MLPFTGSRNRLAAFALISLLLTMAGAAEAARPAVTSAQVRELIARADASDGLGEGFSASRDGSLVVYALDDELHLIEPRRSRRVSLGAGAWPSVSPNGAMIAFWSTRTGARQLHVFEVASGRTRQVTHDPSGVQPTTSTLDMYDNATINRIAWSPDSAALAVSVVSRSPSAAKEESPSNFLDYRADDPAPDPIGDLGRPIRDIAGWGVPIGERSLLRIVQVSKAGRNRILESEVSFIGPAWRSLDEIVGVCRPVRQRDAVAEGPSGLCMASLSSGHVRNVTPFAWRMHAPQVSPDASAAVFAGWTGVPGFKSLVRVDLRTGATHVSRLDREVKGSLYQWTRGGQLVAVLADGLADRLVWLNGRTLHETSRRSGSWKIDGVAASPTTSALFIAKDSPLSPLSVERLERGGAEQVLFTKAAAMSPRETPRFVPLSWRGGRGDLVDGLLLLPPGHADESPIDVIVNPYPGRANWRYKASKFDGTPLLISEGLGVLLINARAPSSPAARSRDRDQANGAYPPTGPAVAAEDVETGLVAAQAAHVGKLHFAGAYGHSNGGATLSYFLSRSHSLGCAVVHSPAFVDRSIFLDYGDPSIIRSWLGERDPWRNAEDFKPLAIEGDLPGWSAKTLLLSGVKDREATKLVGIFNGLRYLGREVELLLLRDEGHSLSNDALVAVWPRLVSFFQACQSQAAVEEQVPRRN